MVIAGSFNYTGRGNKFNDENIIIIGDLETSDPAVDAIQRLIGQYAFDEIDRIYNVHVINYVIP